ncbi:MAG: hypothetical protein IKK84_02350 [Clostridia bacterium]|nr:hypothetical protein [Clostridia bacterium]
MKRSRIICSIITIIYMLLLVYIAICLLKNSITVKSDLGFGIKLVYMLILISSISMYMWLKKRLNKKVTSTKIMVLYRYMYLAVLTLVTRIGMVFVFTKRNVEIIPPSFGQGLGSYLFKLVNLVIGNTIYTNVIINTTITYIVVVLIKKILENITKSDFLSATATILYIFLPQSLYFVIEYNRYNYNLLFVLTGFYIILNIIDLVKQYKLKTKKYLYMSLILGGIASIDIILGGSWMFWMLFVTTLTAAATYIDIAHISFGEKIKSKVSFNIKKILYKIEQTNFSKLINTALIVLALTGVVTIIVSLTTSSTNFVFTTNISELVNRTIEALNTSRNYYIVLIVLIVLLEIIGVILKRNLDIKMVAVKILNILVIISMMLSKNVTYTATIFDVTLILLLVSNMCNIYYNREEKIKLLKDRND